LAVIDCRYDSVTKTIPIPTLDAWSMCFVTYDKLYVGGDGAVSIVDCVADTLIRSYSFVLSRLARGREGKRVHCWRPSALCTLDPAGDTMVVDVPSGKLGGQDLLYAPSVNKVYCADPAGLEECVFVADGETDSVIAVVPLHWPVALGYDSASGLIYCGQTYDSAVTLIDSRTDSVVGTLNVDLYANEFVTVPTHNRVYVGGFGNSFIPVIRTDPPGVGEAPQHSERQKLIPPTLVSGSTPLIMHAPSVLLDAAGRRVKVLTAGANDVRALAPGIYFVRGPVTEDGRPDAVQKVVVTR
jgi:hypothetical protein